MQTENTELHSENALVETHGDLDAIINTDRAYISTPLRTPLQLFKASAAVTAGVVWVLAMVVFAHKSFDYIISLF